MALANLALGGLCNKKPWGPCFSPNPSIAPEATQAVRSGRKAQWHTEIKSYPLRAHVLVEGADERLELGQGTGLCSWGQRRGEQSGWVCLGRREQGGCSPPSTSWAKGAVVGVMPAQQRKQKAGSSASTVPSQWNSEFCCWQRSSPGRFRPALLTPSCLFLAPQRASLSDVGHSSFLSHALNEEGKLL